MLLLWDLAGLGQTGSPGPGPTDTHNRCSFFFSQSSWIKKSFGVRKMGLSISLSFPASHPLHTVNFAYFHITSIKLHSLEPRHCVQHIVATVVNIAVHSWNDKNIFFNRIMSGITYCLLRAQFSLRLLLWSYAHRRSLLHFHNAIFMWKEPASRHVFPTSLNLPPCNDAHNNFFFVTLTYLTNQKLAICGWEWFVEHYAATISTHANKTWKPRVVFIETTEMHEQKE